MANDADAPDGQVNQSRGIDLGSATTEATTSELVEATGQQAEHETDVTASDEAATPSRRPVTGQQVALAVGLAIVVTLTGLTGWLGFRAHHMHQAKDRHELFLQVARQGAVNLTTIDFTRADTDIQRILNSATGAFYDDFSKRSKPFVDVVKQVQSKSIGTVTAAGLESETDHDAQALVAVTVKTSTRDGADQTPRAWRMRISVQNVVDEVKVSNVEFVP